MQSDRNGLKNLQISIATGLSEARGSNFSFPLRFCIGFCSQPSTGKELHSPLSHEEMVGGFLIEWVYTLEAPGILKLTSGEEEGSLGQYMTDCTLLESITEFHDTSLCGCLGIPSPRHSPWNPRDPPPTPFRKTAI